MEKKVEMGIFAFVSLWGRDLGSQCWCLLAAWLHFSLGTGPAGDGDPHCVGVTCRAGDKAGSFASDHHRRYPLLEANFTAGHGHGWAWAGMEGHRQGWSHGRGGSALASLLE